LQTNFNITVDKGPFQSPQRKHGIIRLVNQRMLGREKYLFVLRFYRTHKYTNGQNM